MTDWKKKLGFIVPSWNTVMEYECQRLAPEGVSVHFTRIAHTNDEEETLLHMIHEVPALAGLLAHASLDAICFGCTGGSFVRPNMDREITDLIQEKTGIPATTTATALVEAMREMNVSRVAIASPYPRWLNERLVSFLATKGIEVVGEKGLDTECPAFLPPERSKALAREVDCPDADGIFISCTNFRALEGVEELEAELGKPVLTSNTTTMWHTLRTAGFDGLAVHGGSLMREHLAVSRGKHAELSRARVLQQKAG
ncbi:MAG: maleate cis-trans isomerase [Betaproteobacteria bacterium]|nr:maleate cis-trans isomerase [Betaproteobacteria bacterium]MDH3436497.1 maleate cis-trans isomerase [Betaproteobacteria bacterium]